METGRNRVVKEEQEEVGEEEEEEEEEEEDKVFLASLQGPGLGLWQRGIRVVESCSREKVSTGEARNRREDKQRCGMITYIHTYSTYNT